MVDRVGGFARATKPVHEGRARNLKEGEYWAILAFDLKANGIDLDETPGPQNAASYVLHSEGDKSGDKQDAARGDNTNDRVSADVNERAGGCRRAQKVRVGDVDVPIGRRRQGFAIVCAMLPAGSRVKTCIAGAAGG